ncbi:ribonucleotide-diphosphate reductase subunit beta [Candidatus Falkowbacteria bacterium CG10_big_fil_rev_8_21_14_0_10_37_14]|uniref:Ribonucleoside-diphosphate reductase subunit beta n=1 Tax=Candidatus Falkowbacteria bacterium CG10_big_fil_rev_8_21_14_0_10_37_14 TaxID=1974561 RepID=A0A2M6WSN5_9BACT|nr:ribonucleotide-diphosphate reductase subunit beta [Candidatus Falkowbacteria bacterium]PIT95833.1 MAG: ribonucleotide-diphosphate reductase subunit beta [Candidatus Falkowbacteria bacterium CG10_big_fil_rev_8_21_14_0_10_37_14]
MILGKPLNQDMNLRPIKYQWAYDLYNQAVANTWFPHEVSLSEDLDDWKTMTDDERHAITFLMSFFNPTELIVNRSLALGVYPNLKAPEAHLYLAKQMWEEANHCMAFEYVLETLPIDREAIFSWHLNKPSMKAKEDFVTDYLARTTDSSLDIETLAGKKQFVKNLVSYNIVMEGIWFYSGFMVALSFRQRKKLKNLGSIIDWIVRDESLHLKFGINLILTILEENSELVTTEFSAEIRQLIIKGVELEKNYNEDMFPKGILGLNANYVNQYVQYVADRRLEELGMEPEYNVTNPAKWMATATDTLELVNFFETQNTNYEVDNRATK